MAIAKVKSADEITYFTKSGTVLDGQNSSTTRVFGGGGQNNSPVHISSSTTQHLHLFVRQDDGKEFDTTFDNIGVAVRAGHRVSVIFAMPKNDDGGYATGLVVHDTGRTSICRATANSLVKRFNEWLGLAMGIFLPFVIAAIFGDWSDWGYFWLFGVLLVSGYLFSRKLHSNSVRDAIVDGVQVEMNKAIEQEKARAKAA